MLSGHDAMIVASGHTHIQMLRQHRGRLLVNPGSVGLPFREHVAGAVPSVMAHAEYAIVDASRSQLSVELHRIELDRRALREALSSSDLPLGDMLIRQYVTP
jgi:predicted phosphodiesterase